MTIVDPLFDPAVIEEPYEYYAKLRELDPVHEVEGTGTYLVTRMSLIQEVIADPVTYSSDTIKFFIGRRAIQSSGRPAARWCRTSMFQWSLLLLTRRITAVNARY